MKTYTISAPEDRHVVVHADTDDQLTGLVQKMTEDWDCRLADLRIYPHEKCFVPKMKIALEQVKSEATPVAPYETGDQLPVSEQDLPTDEKGNQGVGIKTSQNEMSEAI
jgi:hypothetical protein